MGCIPSRYRLLQPIASDLQLEGLTHGRLYAVLGVIVAAIDGETIPSVGREGARYPRLPPFGLVPGALEKEPNIFRLFWPVRLVLSPQCRNRIVTRF